MQSTTVSSSLDIEDISLNCNGDFKYKTLAVFSGSGSFKADASKASALFGIDASSSDFSNGPPSNLNVKKCSINLQFSELTLSGDTISVKIIGAFLSLLKNTLSSTITSLACNKIRSVITGTVNPGLVKLNSLIAPFLQPPPKPIDPIIAEYKMLNKTNVNDLIYLSDNFAVNLISEVCNKILGSPPPGEQPSSPILINEVMKNIYNYDNHNSFFIPIDYTLHLNKDIITHSNITFNSLIISGIPFFLFLLYMYVYIIYIIIYFFFFFH